MEKSRIRDKHPGLAVLWIRSKNSILVLFDLNGTISLDSGVLKILLKKMENMIKTANLKSKSEENRNNILCLFFPS